MTTLENINIFDKDSATAYPALATNGAGPVGISYFIGGGTRFPTLVAGLLTTPRREQEVAASGRGPLADDGSNRDSTPHFVIFGRKRIRSTVLAFGGVLLLAYWTILVAELVGDKSIYTVASLTLRFVWWQVLTGVSVAFSLKMLVAVLLGSHLEHLSGKWLALLSAVTFFATSAFFFSRSSDQPPPVDTARGWTGGATVSFAALFFSEWADPGQIAAAVLTAQHKLPLAVWLGGVMALITKSTLGMSAGVKLRNHLPSRLLRRIAAASCLLLGSTSLVKFFAG